MKFDFTKEEYEALKDKLMLNEELSNILEMKIKGYSITKISLQLNMSESTVSRRIKQLKKKIMRILWQKIDKELMILTLFLML